jgi:hypothetical protein
VARGDERVGAQAAADIEHSVALANDAGGERIAHPGRGFERRGRQGIELGRRIADEFGRASPRGKWK